MGVLVTTQSSETPGPEIEINCPHCRRESVAADTFERHERLGLFFVPLYNVRNTFVQCSACSRRLLVRVPASELASYEPQQLDRILVKRASFLVKFFALAGLLLFWAPMIGLVLAVVGLLGSARSGGWPKKVSIAATILAALVTVVFFVISR